MDCRRRGDARDRRGVDRCGAIAGVGLSGQLNGFVLLDEDDRPLGEAVIWLDLRAQAEAAELAAHVMATQSPRSAATRVSPISVLPKLLWMARHRPEVVARARRLMLVKDYILWRLTGVHATDPSDGSATNLMDLAGQTWSEPISAMAGVACRDPAGDRSVHGHRRPDHRRGRPRRPGSPRERPWSPAAATSPRSPSAAASSTTASSASRSAPRGTSFCPASVERPGPRASGRSPTPFPAASVWLGLVMSGGLSLAWLHRTLSLGREPLSFDELVALSDGVEPGARGVTFLPYLEGAATPFDRPDARASLHGLTSSHGAAEIVQAVMEGVAYNIRQCIDLFISLGGRIDEVRLAEGGARVARWCQIIADVVDRPVSVLAEFDASALGAAMLAASGTTGEPLSAIAARAVRHGTWFEPDQLRTAAYEDGFRRYRAISARELGDN